MKRLTSLELIQAFAVKLVLEVFGAAGAIWGFSEAVGLRTNVNVGFWRSAALTVGVIFLIRWVLLLSEELQRKNSDVDFCFDDSDDDEKGALMLSANANKPLYTSSELVTPKHTPQKGSPTTTTPETVVESPEQASLPSIRLAMEDSG